MDEQSGPRPGDRKVPGEPNEGVRIIGAEEAAEAMERGDVASRRSGAEPRYGDRPHGPPAGPRPALRFPLDARADPTQIEKPAVRASEPPVSKPVSGPVDMPHWTEPATGEVPKVVIGDNPDRGDDLDAWSSFATSAPRWRDQQPSEWDDAGFDDPAVLGGEDTRIGALDSTDRPTHEELFSFDELESMRPEDPAPPPKPPRRSLFSRVIPERAVPDPQESSGDEPPAARAVAPSRSQPEPIVEPALPTETTNPADVEGREDETWTGRARRWWRLPAPEPEAETGEVAGPETGELAAADPGPAAVAVPRSETGELAAADPGPAAVAVPRSEPDDVGSVVFDPKFDPEHAYDDDSRTGQSGTRQRISSRNVPDAELDEGPAVVPGGGLGGEEPRDNRAAVVVGVALAILAAIAWVVGPWAVVGLVTIILVLCAGEYFQAMRQVGYEPIAPLGLLAIVGLPLGAYWKGEAALPLLLVLTLVAAMLWYVVGAGGLGRPTDGIGVTLFGVTWIGLFGAFAAVMLRLPDGRGMLGAAVIATVVNDLGAYLVGRAMGTRPLAAASPNKTVEGLVGGGLITVVVMAMLGAFPGIKPFDTLANAVALGAMVAVVAPLGDLCQSVIKRDLDVKDMGTLLPGHGGVFDRFDALLFVLPATYFLLHVLNVL